MKTEITLAEIRELPPMIDLGPTAQALGISKSHIYAMAKLGTLPVKVVRIGGRYKVVTASLLALLEAANEASSDAA